MSVTYLVVGLALAAAALHAAWNVLLKTAGDPLATSTRATVTSAAVISVPAAVAWWLAGRPGLPPLAWLLVLLSALAEVAYFELLSRAYRAGEISTVYPIARGTGPVVAVAGGLLILNERLTSLEALGVGALITGMWLVRGVGRPGAGAGFALATGVMIGAYTVIDGRGVRLASPLLYGWALWVTIAIGLMIRTRLRPLRGPGVDWPRSTLIGLLMTTAYGMALFALSIAPVSVFAPLRESAIVGVTAWGVWRLKERRGAGLRLVGAVVILAGIALIALG